MTIVEFKPTQTGSPDNQFMICHRQPIVECDLVKLKVVGYFNITKFRMFGGFHEEYKMGLFTKSFKDKQGLLAWVQSMKYNGDKTWYVDQDWNKL